MDRGPEHSEETVVSVDGSQAGCWERTRSWPFARGGRSSSSDACSGRIRRPSTRQRTSSSEVQPLNHYIRVRVVDLLGGFGDLRKGNLAPQATRPSSTVELR